VNAGPLVVTYTGTTHLTSDSLPMTISHT
jgi:hypothetical protein